MIGLSNSEVDILSIKENSFKTQENDKPINIVKNSFFIKVSKEINDLKALLSLKKIHIYDEEIIFNTLNVFEMIKNVTNLKLNSITPSVNLYFKYILFFIEKIKILVKKSELLKIKFIQISLFKPKMII